MMLRMVVGSLLVCAGLAQAAPRILQAPAGMPASTQAFVSSRAPNVTETNWFYRDGSEGNYVVIGAEDLLGGRDLGGRAGIEAGALKQVLSIDLAALLRSAPFASELVPPATPNTPTFELVPVVFLGANYELKGKDETESGKKELVRPLTMECTLYVQLLEGVKPIWHARYRVQLSQEYLLTAALDVERVRADLHGCLIEAHRLFAGHVDHHFKVAGHYKFQTTHQGAIRGLLLESELPGHLITPDAFGLSEFPRESVLGEIEPQQKTRH